MNGKRVLRISRPALLVKRQPSLYEFYKEQDHKTLSHYIRRQKTLNWVMSYDDAHFIRDLYKTCGTFHLSLQYSLQRKQKARELLIAPSHIQLPDSVALIDTHNEEAVPA